MSLYVGVDFAGIDGNKPIGWAAAKAAGCRFVIIRGGYGAWTDPAFRAEVQRARDVGLIVSAYLMPIYAKGAPSVTSQVAPFRRAILPIGPGQFPPALDVEFSGGTAKTGRTRRELLELVRDFVIEMRSVFGVAPLLYTSGRVWDGEDADSLDADRSDVDLSALRDCVPWLARYPYNYKLPAVGDDVDEKAIAERLPMPPVPKLWGYCRIHQYQGDARSFAKTIGQCDMNRFFADKPGDHGPGVSWSQRRLGMAESTPGVLDGVTGIALERFQAANGLTADRIMGPQTFSHLAWSQP